MSKRNGGQAACKFNLLLKSNITPPYSHITTRQLPASVSQQLAVYCFIPVSFSLSFSQPYAASKLQRRLTEAHSFIPISFSLSYSQPPTIACQLQCRLTESIASFKFHSLYHPASRPLLAVSSKFPSFTQPASLPPTVYHLQRRLAASCQPLLKMKWRSTNFIFYQHI